MSQFEQHEQHGNYCSCREQSVLSQKEHLFHEQPVVTCRMSEPASAGGLNTGSVYGSGQYASDATKTTFSIISGDAAPVLDAR